MKTTKKEVRHGFGKDYYLLGVRDKKKVWLEAAHWDCGWYWGFGYIETFNRSNPDTSTDIQSHTHWDTDITGKQEYYDREKGCFRDAKYVHHLNDNTSFDATTLTEKESWTLAELMRTFYALKESAETLGRGGAHVTTNPLADIIKNIDETKRINEIVLPAIFTEIYKILAP